MINIKVQEAYRKVDPDSAAVERMWRRIGSPAEPLSFTRPDRESMEWDSGDAMADAPSAGITENVFDEAPEQIYREPDGDYDSASDDEEYAERPVQRRTARHAKPASKHGMGKLPLPVILAAVAVIAVIIVIVVIALKGGKDKPKTGNIQSSLATPAGAASEDLNTALEYSGPDWALEKLKNINSALKEWQDYRDTKQQSYFAEKLPHLGSFILASESFDGTEVEANADDTYTLIHWRYMENWDKTSISPVTGEAIPELTQVMDTENTVTVDAAEYENYVAYTDAAAVAYGDYNYIYSVHDAEEAAKLEEIAAKYALTLRKNDEVSQGYGEIGDSELQAALAEAVGKGNLYTALPYFDHFSYYPNGAFQSCASIALSDGRRMYTNMCSTGYSEMVDGREAGGFTVEDAASMTQRSYTSADGTELTIYQSATQAIVYAYLDNYCVVVDMSINPWREAPASGDDSAALMAKRESDFQISDGIVNFVVEYINYKNIGK